MVETPTAIFDVRLIAAHPRVDVLVIGTNDLAREIRAPLGAGRWNLTRYLAIAVLAAGRRARSILDGVYNDVRDVEGSPPSVDRASRWASTARRCPPEPGRTGNEAWSPTADEIEHARRVIAAYTEAEAEGRGVVTVDGRMIEHLHVANAERTLALAEAIAANRN